MQIPACTGLIRFHLPYYYKNLGLGFSQSPVHQRLLPSRRLTRSCAQPGIEQRGFGAAQGQRRARQPGTPVPAGLGRQTGTFFWQSRHLLNQGVASCLLSTSHSTREQYLPLGWPHVSGDFVARFWMIYYNNQKSRLINCFQLYKYKNLPSILSRMTVKQLFI